MSASQLLELGDADRVDAPARTGAPELRAERAGSRSLRILTLTTLYPNAASSSHGIFVENRLRAFADRTGAEVRVVAPVPWFPIGAAWAGKYGAFARAPKAETRHGIEIRHPRYVLPPRIGMTYAARALERCFLQAARGLIAEGWDFDLIDAHYLYPDGVAAARAARKLGKPVVLTARGSDVTLIPGFPRQRAMILDAVRSADAVIAVAAALKKELVETGAPAEKIHALRNGVDLDCFRPLDRVEARTRLDVAGNVIVSVGHLIERKGHGLAIGAAAQLPDVTLLIVGEGDERRTLESLARRLGVRDRVRFLGAVPHEKLAEIYSAADALVLASSREGWPNVLLEAMACGTPVIATPVHGSLEIIAAPAAGLLARERSAQALAEALSELFADPPSRAATRRYAEQYSWEETSDSLETIFGGIAARRLKSDAVRTRRIRMPDDCPPRLLVTVDAEEIFDWSARDRSARVAPPKDIERFQSLAVSLGIRPLYFLTYPVIDDAAAQAYFRTLRDEDAADLGLHFHHWSTPPLEGFEGEYYSYQCNLPAEAQRKKAAHLAERYIMAFGERPRAHRAGRYGMTKDSYAALAAIGLDYDFSPSPAFDFSRSGGPDFSRMTNEPFSLELEDEASIAVTPVSGAATIRGERFFLPRRASAGVGFDGAVTRLSPTFFAPLRLSPEGARLSELKALTRRLIADGARIITFSLHSTTMTPGANPYARDEADVAAVLEKSANYFEFFNDVGGEFMSFGELQSLYDAALR